MSDLIEREDAIDAITYQHLDNLTMEERIVLIESIPSAERKGEWIEQHENGHGFWVGVCSQCGEEKLVDNYCPNCGARMKGEHNGQ